MSDIKLFLRGASEPTFKDRGYPQSEYRTREHWVQLFIEGGKYLVEFGDCRGFIKGHELEERSEADYQFNYYKGTFEMEEDSFKEVWKENSKLSLAEILRAYFEEGDTLEPDMDSMLAQIREDTRIRYSYRNLYANSNGYLALVKFRFRKQVVPVFIEEVGNGPLVKHIG